ncbi:hypothetical protein ACHAW6_012726 [Cyclotella cf. meneghiniana]
MTYTKHQGIPTPTVCTNPFTNAIIQNKSTSIIPLCVTQWNGLTSDRVQQYIKPSQTVNRATWISDKLTFTALNLHLPDQHLQNLVT